MITIIGVIGVGTLTLIYWMLADIRSDLRHNNTLMKYLNDILEEQKSLLEYQNSLLKEQSYRLNERERMRERRNKA